MAYITSESHIQCADTLKHFTNINYFNASNSEIPHLSDEETVTERG